MSPAASSRGTGGDVHIDRLALRVSGLDEGAARALARLVAERLAAGLLRPAGAAGLDSLTIEVTPGDTDRAGPDALARHIADQVRRALEVTP
jgi:hypothetical protein